MRCARCGEEVKRPTYWIDYTWHDLYTGEHRSRRDWYCDRCWEELERKREELREHERSR